MKIVKETDLTTENTTLYNLSYCLKSCETINRLSSFSMRDSAMKHILNHDKNTWRNVGIFIKFNEHFKN